MVEVASREGTRHGEARCVWDTRWGTWTLTRDPGELEHPSWTSRIWVCWLCGEIWARECMLDRGELQSFDILHAPCGCASGEYWGGIPGSLTFATRYPLEAFQTLPVALQRREADLLLQLSQRGTA